MRELREACARVCGRARWVRIETAGIPGYAAVLPLERQPPSGPDRPGGGRREEVANFWLTLDAINFGSGWFPTLTKRAGCSGYATIEAGWRDRFAADGPWSAAELAAIGPDVLARTLGQSRQHPLIERFVTTLRDLGARVGAEHGGAFAAVADAADGSAVALAHHLGDWPCFADTSRYAEIEVPFLKRAQIAAADLARAGVTAPEDLGALTMFADNLVPHVLRVDGILTFDPALVARICGGELIEHGSPEEIEIRASAVHAVELIVAARGGTCPVEVDQLLWQRGGQPRYKAVPRHRSRCTAY